MKKVLSLILSATLVCALAIPAFAADKTLTAAGSDTAIVKTSTTTSGGDSAETFEVKFPAETVIPWGTTSTTINYTAKSQLGFGKKLTVGVAADHSVLSYVADASNTFTLAYALSGDTAFAGASPVVNETKALNVAIATAAWDAAVVGEYSDTLTFTVAVA